MLLVCYSYVTRMLLVCYSYVTRMYSCSVLVKIENEKKNGRGKVIFTLKIFGEDLKYSPKRSVSEIANFFSPPKPSRLQDLENSAHTSTQGKRARFYFNKA